MSRKTELLPALKDWGLNVIEVNGWQWRGSSSFNPGGSVNHHTAGYRYNSIPSLNVLINGHGSLPGPLCQVGQSRSTQYNSSQRYDDVYLVAAGRSNHAGRGGWNGLVGNSSVFGLEIEHTGSLNTEQWPERRAETAYKVHCAFADVGGFDVSMISQHKEWAPRRKIDFIGANGNNFRSQVHNTQRIITPIEELDMATKMAWLRPKKGSNTGMHCYQITGNIASWFPTHDSINLAKYLKTPWVGGNETNSKLDPAWWQSLAVMNGPLKNV